MWYQRIEIEHEVNGQPQTPGTTGSKIPPGKRKQQEDLDGDDDPSQFCRVRLKCWKMRKPSLSGPGLKGRQRSARFEQRRQLTHRSFVAHKQDTSSDTTSDDDVWDGTGDDISDDVSDNEAIDGSNVTNDNPPTPPLFDRLFGDKGKKVEQKHAADASREHHRKNPINYYPESRGRFTKSDALLTPALSASRSRRHSPAYSSYSRRPTFDRQRPSQPPSEDFDEQFRRKYDLEPNKADPQARTARSQRADHSRKVMEDDDDDDNDNGSKGSKEEEEDYQMPNVLKHLFYVG